MLSSKDKGQLVEAYFQYLILEKSFVISKPYGDNAKYDFIVDNKNKLLKVQVKSTFSKRANGGYQVKACHGTKVTKDRYKQIDIDYLVAYIEPTKDWYIIPFEALSSAVVDVFPEKLNSLGKYEKYKNNWELLKD